MLLSLSAICILLILSAFFSGSETALTAASRPLMHQLERTGHHGAQLVNRLLDDKAKLIGAILLGNNLVNILASALATSLLIAHFGEAGVAYATIVMTSLVLIFAEILPKTYAFRNADKAALVIAPPVNIFVMLLSPVTKAINYLVRGIFRLAGVKAQTDDAIITGETELRGAIELHDGDETGIRHKRAMLINVLDLADVQVGEIMTHRKNVTMIDASQPADEVIAQVLASPYTRIPLWRDEPDNIVGILHAKELLRAVGGQDENVKNLDIVALAASPWFIPETTALLYQLQAFRHRHEHFALVVDEYGSFMGIVTLEDILEEIVGEISDEHDIAVTGARRRPDGSYVVQGSVTIRDINRQFEWNLPDEEAATVAGLILHESRRIPEIGQAFMFHGFRFEILHRQRHQITSVSITPPQDSAGDDTPVGDISMPEDHV